MTHDRSVAALGRSLRDGTLTSEELTRNALARVASLDGQLHAFVRVDGDNAMAAALVADAELQAGQDRGPMHGIPYALKDIYDAAGLPTTCHSRLRLQTVATEDSAVAARFRAGGAILLGKLATYEFALGGPSFDLPFPPARNPWNPRRVPGGSSSGSAAAVAAGFVRVAPGSCTAGSIRGPAAWCGTVGMKPTYGRVSRHGVFPLAWSLDHCGSLTRSVEDAAAALQVMAGYDPRDPASADMPVPAYCAGLGDGVAGLRVGVPRTLFAHDPALSADARDGIAHSLAVLRDAGASVIDVPLPDYGLYRSCNRVIMTAEMYAIHRTNLQKRLPEYGEIAARRFASGVAIDAADYLAAQRLRRMLTSAVDAALDRCDVLVTAISLDVAPPFGPHGSAWPLQPATFNVSGHPAMSVPVGLSRDGLPLAVQVAGRPFDEATVFRVGRALECLTGWERMPLPSDVPDAAA